MSGIESLVYLSTLIKIILIMSDYLVLVLFRLLSGLSKFPRSPFPGLAWVTFGISCRVVSAFISSLIIIIIGSFPRNHAAMK